MNITIVGAGNMGSALVKQLTGAGHTVRVTARDMAKARNVAAANPGAIAAVPAEALGNSSVVIAATFYDDAVAALKSLGSLEGRVVVDISNPVTADFMALAIGHDTSAAEEIARALPEAEVVKAFNTVFAPALANGPRLGNGSTIPVYIAGDSDRAKRTVSDLVRSMGFATVDAGALRNARYLEPLGGLNIFFGYGAGHGTDIAPAWLGLA